MLPTLFKIPFLPDWLADIKSYGVLMMIAFLSSIWLCVRRADRSQANPDTVLNVGFLSLIFGVAGARAMFVIHYWETRFANQPNPFMAIFDIRAGGLEFWGGPLLVIPVCMIYLRFIAKTSIRWHLDISIPSLAWGLAITRIGCFLNGCCWGAVCVNEQDVHRNEASVPWAVRFPYGSNALRQQYEFGQITLPRELIFAHASGQSFPLPREWIDQAIDDDGRTRKQLEADIQARDKASARKLADFRNNPIGIVEAQCQAYSLSPRQLGDLAARFKSKPVHPSQLYAMINAFIISWLLSTLFYYRRRHGVILGWFLVLYSISRVLLESIRQDNPLDVGGVTISQAISVATFLIGVVWLAVMHRLPRISPRAVPFIPPEEEEPPPTAKVKKTEKMA